MEKKSDTYQIASDIQWEYAGDGIVRQIMAYDEHLMMVKVKFNQGAIGTLHQHPHTQSTYVASGCFEVTIGEEKKVLRAGDGYYVAPNLPHGCVWISEADITLLVALPHHFLFIAFTVCCMLLGNTTLMFFLWNGIVFFFGNSSQFFDLFRG